MVSESNFQKDREQMINKQLCRRGIDNKQVLNAFRKVPRHKFVSNELQASAYEDRPLPIGNNQTISQPFIVAKMISALNPTVEDIILEIGAGSGYAAALLSRIVKKVFAVERYQSLVEKAEENFSELGYDNIEITAADGTRGWPGDSIKFDGILVSAAAPDFPETMLNQLKTGGALVIPVGSRSLQQLYKVLKKPDGSVVKEELGGVRFVPLIGEEGWKY